MKRRTFFGTTAAVGMGVVAGCLETLGFERESAWSTPPLVEDRPDAVYVPAAVEEMGVYGRETVGEYVLELSYTIPHRFWTLAGEDERVDVESDDSLHLMQLVWDRETGTILPVDLGLEIHRDGEPIGGVGTPWPMLSQRMGHHYGDNISFPEDGTYTARLEVGPLDVEETGAFADRFDDRETVSIEFEYANSDVLDLEIDTIETDRRGERDAVPLMDHDDHGDHDEAHPRFAGTPVEDLAGEVRGTERTGDAALSVISAEEGPTDEDQYLAVTLRTPYNDVPIPDASLSARVGDEDLSLVERLDDRFGHHYGTGLPSPAESVTITVDRPPQVSRHDGYETAFNSFDSVSVEW